MLGQFSKQTPKSEVFSLISTQRDGKQWPAQPSRRDALTGVGYRALRAGRAGTGARHAAGHCSAAQVRCLGLSP